MPYWLCLYPCICLHLGGSRSFFSQSFLALHRHTHLYESCMYKDNVVVYKAELPRVILGSHKSHHSDDGDLTITIYIVLLQKMELLHTCSLCILITDCAPPQRWVGSMQWWCFLAVLYNICISHPSLIISDPCYCSHHGLTHFFIMIYFVFYGVTQSVSILYTPGLC